VEPLPTIELSDRGCSRGDVIAVSRRNAPVELAGTGRSALERSAEIIARLADSEEPVYGVSTGFGSLANTVIPDDRTEELQRSLLRSHAAGMGREIEVETVRAMMFLRARSLAMGFSGVRPEVVETMLALLNAGLTPLVPEYGSLGASGDLAPMAHAALALLGEGEVRSVDGEVVAARDALASLQLDPLDLGPKEGLSLINGTDGMLGMLCLALDDISRLVTTADVAGAMTTEALLGTDRAFAADLVEMRPHPGQIASAANLRMLLAGSPLVASHRHNDDRVQDAYSLRCTPQVHGALRDTVAHAGSVADRELVSAIDNPVVLHDGRVESAGNFHGAPLAYVADFLAVAIADAGSLAERRTDRLLDPNRSHGLPAFLTPDPGVNSGMMIAHYTQAAMVAENKRLATPASVDSIPTSALQEDHVSLGWHACRKLREVIANFGRILAVELVCASRALELRRPLEAAVATGAAAGVVAEAAGGVGADRFLAPELASVERLVGSHRIARAVEDATNSRLL
jgi:histidine ammonia-lyase